MPEDWQEFGIAGRRDGCIISNDNLLIIARSRLALGVNGKCQLLTLKNTRNIDAKSISQHFVLQESRQMSCCKTMKYLEFKCKIHEHPHDCPDHVMAKFGNRIGIPIRDGGSSFVEIKFCPWCGVHVINACPP